MSSGHLEKQYEAHLLPSNICNGLERIIAFNWIAYDYVETKQFNAERLRELLMTIEEVANSLLYQVSSWEEKQPDGKLYEIFNDMESLEKLHKKG